MHFLHRHGARPWARGALGAAVAAALCVSACTFSFAPSAPAGVGGVPVLSQLISRPARHLRQRLALRMGMIEEGRRRKHLFLEGGWQDKIEFGLLRDDFLGPQSSAQ